MIKTPASLRLEPILLVSALGKALLLKKVILKPSQTALSFICVLFAGAQVKLDVTRTMKTSSAFCNKIWQAARFLLLTRERKPEFKANEKPPSDQR
jgi:valyl-tRNA synthetase